MRVLSPPSILSPGRRASSSLFLYFLPSHCTHEYKPRCSSEDEHVSSGRQPQKLGHQMQGPDPLLLPVVTLPRGVLGQDFDQPLLPVSVCLLACLMRRSYSAGFWIPFGGNCSLCSCGWRGLWDEVSSGAAVLPSQPRTLQQTFIDNYQCLPVWASDTVNSIPCCFEAQPCALLPSPDLTFCCFMILEE